MANIETRDAGRVMGRPGPISRLAEEAAERGVGAAVERRSAGPVRDRDVAAGEPQPRTGTPGMLGNPWVQQFASGQAPRAPGPPEAGAPAVGDHAPQEGARPPTQVDAGHAPEADGSAG
jgi:hypothetical protein